MENEKKQSKLIVQFVIAVMFIIIVIAFVSQLPTPVVVTP